MKITGKVPNKLVAGGEEAEGAEAAVWRGGHTHRSFLGVSSSPSCTTAFPLPHALVRVTHSKRGSGGMKSESAGNEESKHPGEGVAKWRGAIKHALEDKHGVCVCVSSYNSLWWHISPLSALDLKTSSPCTHTDLYLFCAVGVHGLRSPPSTTWLYSTLYTHTGLLKHALHKCTIQPSNGTLCEAVHISKAFKWFDIYSQKISESAL